VEEGSEMNGNTELVAPDLSGWRTVAALIAGAIYAMVEIGGMSVMGAVTAFSAAAVLDVAYVTAASNRH
jgi:hypothetical protein